MILVSASTDSTLRFWNAENCLQTWPCPKSGFVLDLALVQISAKIVWIFASLDNCTVQIFANEGSSGDFVPVHCLTGAEDWIQALASVRLLADSEDILLACGSQDSFIRVWRFRNVSEAKAMEEQRRVIDLAQGEEIKAKEVVFAAAGLFYSVSVETILAGHDDKVFAVQWQVSKENQVRLLSASFDKTMILWQPDQEANGLWIEAVRVGEVGGNTLGFLGCQMHESGHAFLGHSFNGALHLWILKEDNWLPGVTVGGHFDSVEDLDWDQEGRYLIR